MAVELTPSGFMSVGTFEQQRGGRGRSSGGSGGSGGSDQPQSIRDEEIFLATGQNVEVGSQAAADIRSELARREAASEIQRSRTQERAKEIAVQQERLKAFRSLSKKEQVELRRRSGVEAKTEKLLRKKPSAKLKKGFRAEERFIEVPPEKITGVQKRSIGIIKVDDTAREFPKSRFVARTATGGVSVPGTIVKSFFGFSEIFGKKTGLSKIGPKIPARIAIGTGSEIVRSTFFLGPLAGTRQVETKLATRTKVLFQGVSQRIEGSGVLTKVKFVSEKGKIFEKGSLNALSVVKESGDISKVVTVGAGGTFRRGVNLLGKETLKVGRGFAGAEVSLVKTQGERSISIGAGKVIPDVVRKVKPIRFASKSVGKRVDDVTQIVSKATTESGDLIAAGTIKEFTESSTSSLTSQPQVSQIALQQTKSLAKASAIKPVTPSLNPTPVISKLTTTATTTTPQLTAITKPVQIGKVVTKVSTKTVQKLVVGSGVAQKTKQQLKQKASQKVSLGQATIPLTSTIQKVALGVKVKTISPEITRGRGIIKIPTSITPLTSTKPISSFSIKQTRVIKQPTKTFTVGVRKQRGFVSIGSGLSLRRAFQIGKSRTLRTPATAFKVTPVGGALRTPKGFKKRFERREGVVFLELPKLTS